MNNSLEDVDYDSKLSFLLGNSQHADHQTSSSVLAERSLYEYRNVEQKYKDHLKNKTMVQQDIFKHFTTVKAGLKTINSKKRQRKTSL